MRRMIANSGETAKATSSNTAVEVLAATATAVTQIVIANEGGVAGFFSIDAGTTWGRLPASHVTVLTVDLAQLPAVQIKRVEDGSNVTGVYAYAIGG